MALRTVYDRISPSEMAKYTGQNPWWGLGYLLAQNYNRNYDQRGIEKATEAGTEALEKAKASITGDTDYKGANIALGKVAENYITDFNDKFKNPLAGQVDSSKTIGMGGSGQPQIDVNSIVNSKAINPQNGDVYGLTYTPIAKDTSFSADDFRSKFIKEQQALGRPDYQIQQALATIEPQIKKLDEQARDIRANETLKQLAGMAPDLENPERMKIIRQLAKDDPKLAEILFKTSITPKDKWQAQKARELAEQNAKNARELAAINNVARAMGTRRNGYSSGGNSNTRNVNVGGNAKNGSVFDSSKFKYAEKRLEEINEYEELNGGLPDNLRNEKRNLEYYKNQVIKESFPDAPLGLQDRPKIDKLIEDAKSKNVSNKDILEELAKQVETGKITKELYDAINEDVVYNEPYGPLYDSFMRSTQPTENPFAVNVPSAAQQEVRNNPSGPLYDALVTDWKAPQGPFDGPMPMVSIKDALFSAINPYNAKYQDAANIGRNTDASKNSDVVKNNPSGPLFDAFMNDSKLENKFTGGTPLMSTKDALFSVLQPNDANYQQVPEIGNTTLNPRQGGLLQEDASSNIVPSRGGARPDIQALQGVKDMYEADYPYNKDFVYNEPQTPRFDINEFRYYKEKPSDHSEMNYYYEEVAANEADSYANEGRNGIHYGNNPIVNRVRDLVGIVPYNDDDGTNCVRTLSIALGDSTPYGGHYHVDQLVNTAAQYGDLVTDTDNYIPQPGDIAIVNDGGHAVMITERGGTIQNGKRKNGVYESARPVESLNGKVKYYITTSRYSDMYR